MARQRKLTPERKAFIQELWEHYEPKNINDVQDIIKDLLGDTLQNMLEFMNDLKLVYKADNEDLALQNLDRLDEKWSGKYPNIIKYWRANWLSLATFFRYPPELRRMIYTTNAIENFNRQLRKVTKTRSIFPTDDVF